MSKPPRFKPKRGQTNYTNIRYAPVVHCILRYRGKVLVVQRSKALRLEPGNWGGIAGFLDDKKDFDDKVKEEIREEAGITSRYIKKIVRGEIFHREAPTYGKTWIVHPVLVDVTTQKVKLNWEARQYQWLTTQEAKKLKPVTDLPRVLELLLE